MPRTPIRVRLAAPDDAVALLALWDELPRRTAPEHPGSPVETQAASAIARSTAAADRRLLVAEAGGEVVGAALAVRLPLSPLLAEDSVHVGSLRVAASHRRLGVGRLLLEAAATWGAELGVGTVSVTAGGHDRDANRFLARLGLAPVGVLRAAPVSKLRSRRRGTPARDDPHVVLARRRWQRGAAVPAD